MQEYTLEHFRELFSLYLDNNIKHYHSITRNVVSQQLIKKKLRKHDSIVNDALNECIILMSDKIERDYKKNIMLTFLFTQTDFDKYFTSFITNTIHWQALDKLNNNESNIFLTRKDENELLIIKDEDDTIKDEDILSEEYIYINAENDDAYTKLYKIDLVHAGLPLKSAEKLQYIKKIKKHLTEYERELFILHYECELNPLKVQQTFKNENSPYFKSIHKIRKDISLLKNKIKTIVNIIKDDF